MNRYFNYPTLAKLVSLLLIACGIYLVSFYSYLRLTDAPRSFDPFVKGAMPLVSKDGKHLGDVAIDEMLIIGDDGSRRVVKRSDAVRVRESYKNWEADVEKDRAAFLAKVKAEQAAR